MISYLPYTYIPMERLRWLCGKFPGLSIYLPGDGFASDGMRRLVAEQRLEIRLPRTVDGDRLQAVIKDFNAWTQLHPQGIGDLKAYFKTHQGQPPLLDENSPARIRGMIRQFGQTTVPEAADPLFQAALLLSLAHRLDEQQADLDREWGSIRQKERRLFSDMSGNPENAGQGLSGGENTRDKQPEQGAEIHVIRGRLRAWATLAADDPQNVHGFITTSRVVMEEMLELFPEYVALGGRYLDKTSGNVAPNQLDQSEQPEQSGPGKADLQDEIHQLAFSGTISGHEMQISPGESLERANERVQLMLYAIPGCSPREALARMEQGWEGTTQMSIDMPGNISGPVNTVLGWIDGI